MCFVNAILRYNTEFSAFNSCNMGDLLVWDTTPTSTPPTPGARHLDVVWRHGEVSPARTDQNRGAGSLPQLGTALKIFCQFPVGHPPHRDAGR